MSTLDLIKLAGFGVNISIDAQKYSTLDIMKVVSSVGLKNTHLTIKNAQSKSTLDLMKIIGTYAKNITLDFS